MERGYVKLWRKTLDSGLIQNPAALQVFTYLLLNATHRPYRQLVGTTIVNLEPGQVVTGRQAIAKECKLSEQNVRTALKLLENLEILTIKPTNKYSVISFVKWDTYQQEQPASQPTNQPASNQQVTSSQPAANHKQEQKNIRTKEQEKTYSSAPKNGAPQATLLPVADALISLPLNDGSEFGVTQADIDEWQGLYPAINVLQELRNMRGWFLGNPTKHKTRRGIGRFVHSWLSKAQDKAGRPEQRRLSFQEEREQRELEKFLNDDRPLWGMTSSGGNNGQDPF